MTAALESTRQSDLSDLATVPVVPVSVETTEVAAVRAALAGLFPPALIGLGVILTLAWIGSLTWLLVRSILAMI